MKALMLFIGLGPILLFGQTSDATPPSSVSAFVKYLNNNFTINRDVVKDDLSGIIELEFRVNEAGVLDSFNIVNDIGGGAALDLIKVIKKAGNWNPALENGQPKVSWVSLPYKVLSFDEVNKEDVIEATPEDGIEKFRNNFLKNFLYPEKALNAGINGTFTLQFDVNEKGKVENIKLLESPGYDIDINAIRAFKRSGKWKPAYLYNKSFNSTVEFEFTLNLKEFKRGVF